MIQSLIFGGFLLAAVVHGPGGAGEELVVPTKITVVPPESFRRGARITLKATFAADRTPDLSGLCEDRGFAVRIYDAKRVEAEPPRVSAESNSGQVIPVTPYLQQSGAPLLPLPGPEETTVEKIFEPCVVPAKKTARMPRLFVALFQVCGAVTAKGIDETGRSVIYDDPLNGSYRGGTFFRVDCTGKPSSCVYRPE